MSKTISLHEGNHLGRRNGNQYVCTFSHAQKLTAHPEKKRKKLVQKRLVDISADTQASTPIASHRAGKVTNIFGSEGARRMARPSLIPSLCTRFTRAGIEWRR